MADNLATIDGKVAMAYIGDTPWHRMGQDMSLHPGSHLNVALALEVGGMGWTVSTHPIYLGDGRLVPDRSAVIRSVDNAYIATVGHRYSPIQNADAFAPFQYAIDNYGVTIETLGALGNGEVVWMQAKLPDTNGHVVPGDRVQPFFLIATSHDGTSSLTGRASPQRVVCHNTLGIAMRRSRAEISIRHTTNAQGRISEITRLIEELTSQYHETMEVYKALAHVTVSDMDVKDYAQELFPGKPAQAKAGVASLDELLTKPFVAEDLNDQKIQKFEKNREQMFELFKGGRGHELAGPTAWGAYNALTEFVDHVQVARADGTLRKNGDRSAMFGAGNDLKQKALELAVEMWIPNANLSQN